MNVTQNAPPLRSATSRQSVAGSAVNFSVDPTKFLASLLTASATAVSYDMNCGVVSLLGKGRYGDDRQSLVDIARHSRVTLTKALTLRAGMAESHNDVDSAHHLVRRRYAWRGYEIPEAEPSRSGFSASGDNVVFVAKQHDSIVGTITLGLDGRAGLLAEHTYPEAIEARRAHGCKVCEVTRLAVAEQADSKPVLAALFSLAFATASAHGITDVFIEVTPRHAAFYSRVLGFAVACKGRVCQRVGVESALLSLKMEQLEQRLMTLNARVFPQPECKAA